MVERKLRREVAVERQRAAYGFFLRLILEGFLAPHRREVLAPGRYARTRDVVRVPAIKCKDLAHQVHLREQGDPQHQVFVFAGYALVGEPLIPTPGALERVAPEVGTRGVGLVVRSERGERRLGLLE